MLSSMERRKLLKQMQQEPVRSYMVLAKCAAGLTIVALIAVIGARDPVSPEGAGNVAAGSPPPAYSPQAHPKEVTSERRRQPTGAATQRNSVAGGKREPAYLSPAMMR